MDTIRIHYYYYEGMEMTCVLFNEYFFLHIVQRNYYTFRHIFIL